MALRMIRNVTPALNTGAINPIYKPYSDITTTNVERIMALVGVDLPYNLSLFLWFNRWANPLGNPKGNLPEIAHQEGGEKYRFFFTTQNKSIAASAAQFYSIVGQFDKAEAICETYGINFVHWFGDRSVLKSYLSNMYNGYTDCVILYPAMPHVKTIVCDVEMQDKRSSNAFKNIINRAYKTLKVSGGKEIIFWGNRFGSAGAINTGATDINYITQRFDAVMAIAFDEGVPDDNGMEVIEDIQQQRELINNDAVFCVNVELRNNTMEDHAIINQYMLDNINDLNWMSVWRFGANLNHPETQAEIERLTRNLRFVDYTSSDTDEETDVDCEEIEEVIEPVDINILHSGKVNITVNGNPLT